MNSVSCSTEAPLSKSAQKNKKKKEAKKRREDGENAEKENWRGQTAEPSNTPAPALTSTLSSSELLSAISGVELTGNPEKDKRIKNIKKVRKLVFISILNVNLNFTGVVTPAGLFGFIVICYDMKYTCSLKIARSVLLLTAAILTFIKVSLLTSKFSS